MPPWAEALGLLAGVERWLLPAECLLCARPVGAGPEEPLVCPVCRSRWIPLPDPLCPRCGQPLEGNCACRICAGWPPGFVMARSAVWLTGGARDAVHHFKYGGWWRVAEAMAGAVRTLPPVGKPGLLIPLPLGSARRRERGYNQSEILARQLGRAVPLPVRADLLTRVRETRRQTGLAPDARQANVSGAFRARWPDPSVPAVLVDDVFTTGATLLAAAQALLAAGAREVRAVTFARARRPLDDDVARLAESGDLQ